MLGYRTLSYLAFCLMDFGLPVDWRVYDALAETMRRGARAARAIP